MSELLGKTIGNYYIEQLLGKGGHAEVYLARHLLLKRWAAIKVMQAHIAEETHFRERFLQEAQIAFDLRHPHIVEIYDFGEQEGSLYLVMEWMNSGSFKMLLEAPYASSIAFVRKLQLLAQAAEGLHFLHEHGIVHRDVKPANLLLTATLDHEAEYTLKISDFGVARMMQGGVKTSTGLTLGTLAYMSPEQCKDDGVLDGRSDVYALGIVLYEMATGKLPFDVTTPYAIIFKHIQEDPPPPRTILPDIPVELESIILQCLKKRKEERYESAYAFALILKEACNNEAIRNWNPQYVLKTPDGETTVDTTQAAHISIPKSTPRPSDDVSPSKASLKRVAPPLPIKPSIRSFEVYAQETQSLTPSDKLPPQPTVTDPNIKSKRSDSRQIIPTSQIPPIGIVDQARPSSKKLAQRVPIVTSVLLAVVFVFAGYDLFFGHRIKDLYFHFVALPAVELETAPIVVAKDRKDDLRIYSHPSGEVLGIVTETVDGREKIEQLGSVSMAPKHPDQIANVRPLLWRIGPSSEIVFSSQDFSLPFDAFYRLFLRGQEVWVCFQTQNDCRSVRYLHPLKTALPIPFDVKMAFPLTQSDDSSGLQTHIPYPQTIQIKAIDSTSHVFNSPEIFHAEKPINASMTWKDLIAPLLDQYASILEQSFSGSHKEPHVITVTFDGRFSVGQTNFSWGKLTIQPQAWISPEWIYDAQTSQPYRFFWQGPQDAAFTLKMEGSPKGTWESQRSWKDAQTFIEQGNFRLLDQITKLEGQILEQGKILTVQDFFQIKTPPNKHYTYQITKQGQVKVEGNATNIEIKTAVSMPVEIYCNGKKIFEQECKNVCTIDFATPTNRHLDTLKPFKELSYMLNLNHLTVARFLAMPKSEPVAVSKTCPAQMIQIAPTYCIDRYEFSIQACEKLTSCQEFLNGEEYTWIIQDFPQISWKAKDMPLVLVTTEQAEHFCKARMGNAGTLPTLEQWKQAAAGLEKKATRNFNTLEKNRQSPRLQSVLSLDKDLSDLGVIGLGGNVSEWVKDGNQNYACGTGFDESSVQDHPSSCKPYTKPSKSRGFRCVYLLEKP